MEEQQQFGCAELTGMSMLCSQWCGGHDTVSLFVCRPACRPVCLFYACEWENMNASSACSEQRSSRSHFVIQQHESREAMWQAPTLVAPWSHTSRLLYFPVGVAHATNCRYILQEIPPRLLLCGASCLCRRLYPTRVSRLS